LTEFIERNGLVKLQEYHWPTFKERTADIVAVVDDILTTFFPEVRPHKKMKV
jgi:hypothetical protein